MDFISIEKESLDRETCNNIIKLFEEETNKYNGETSSGYNPEIKKTTDFCILWNISIESKWYEINNLLVNKMQKHIETYAAKMKEIFNIMNINQLCDTGFLIQKYEKNKGKFTYHNDFQIDERIEMHRILTFIWYLNDVEIGGETEFCGDFKVNPEAGKFIFFPASWCYPHMGKMPISDNKYIITGWLYKK
jgi:hypothetical protein